jgi:hypothetical protein
MTSSWRDVKTGVSELFTTFFHRFKQLFKKVVVEFVRNFYAYGDIVKNISSQYFQNLKFSWTPNRRFLKILIFFAKYMWFYRTIPRGTKLGSIFRVQHLKERTILCLAACQRFAQFSTIMPLKRFLNKGERPLLSIYVFLLKTDQLDNVIRW